MMTTEQQTSNNESFHKQLEQLYGSMDRNDAMQKIYSKAWDQYLTLGLPTRQNEVFRYIHLRDFFANVYELAHDLEVSPDSIDPHILPECSQSVLVFVNGHFHLNLSRISNIPNRVVISTLSEAMRTYSGFLNSQWTKSLKEETDPLVALNGSMHNRGLFLYIPPKTVITCPIQILHITDTQSKLSFILPRIQIFVGSQSQVTLASTQCQLSGEGYAINAATEFTIEEDAHVSFTQITQLPTDNVWFFDALRATLKRNSAFKTIAISNGSATVRHDYRVNIAGENAEAQLNGMWMLSGKREAHAHILMDHQAPNCRSMQLFKSALNDFSRSSFEGKILVRQQAQKTEAFQLNNNLLLSDRAHADSKPNLEIFADDVKASHGATMGQLDKEQIFYMKTRGFSESSARSLLVRSFCLEIIDMIPIPSLRQHVIATNMGV